MRSLFAVAVVLLGVSVSGLAQQNGTFKVKHTPEKAPKKSAPIVTNPGAKTAAAANAQQLKNLEHQTARSSSLARSGSRKTSRASALKPVKDKPAPPINFGGSGGGKSAGLSNQGSNPYKGRLRQKHGHQ